MRHGGRIVASWGLLGNTKLLRGSKVAAKRVPGAQRGSTNGLIRLRILERSQQPADEVLGGLLRLSCALFGASWGHGGGS